MTDTPMLFKLPPRRQLDEHAKTVGRRGIARARAVLAAHRPDEDAEYRRHLAARQALARTHTRITTGRTQP